VLHNNLGVALRERGQLDKAIGHFEEAIRLDPKGAYAPHVNLGSTLSLCGRQGEAMSHFEEIGSSSTLSW
jgi:tetratricopeptide (TPR) repeat protein